MMTSDDDDIISILPISVRISPFAPFAHVYRVENCFIMWRTSIIPSL